MAKPPADRARIAGLEAVLAGVLRRSRLGIVVLAGDASVVWANDAALQTLPALDPARPGANLVDVVDVAAAGGDWARLIEALATRTTLPAFELPVFNGRWLRVELQAFSKDLVADPRLAATLALQDVTLRRRARERERVEGELMRQTGQLGRVGAWEYDVTQRHRALVGRDLRDPRADAGGRARPAHLHPPVRRGVARALAVGIPGRGGQRPGDRRRTRPRHAAGRSASRARHRPPAVARRAAREHRRPDARQHGRARRAPGDRRAARSAAPDHAGHRRRRLGVALRSADASAGTSRCTGCTACRPATA